MPDTLVGLVIFAALATPGFLYESRRRRYRAGPASTAFQELAAVSMISIMATLCTVAAFLAVDAVIPRIAPDLQALVDSPAAALRASFRQWFFWGSGLLALASLAAWALAKLRYPSDRARTLKEKALWERMFRDLDQSAEHGDGFVYANLKLTDGAELLGYLKEYDATYDNPDRDLLLSWPILARNADGQTSELDQSYVWVSARHIVSIGVKYDVPHPAFAAS